MEKIYYIDRATKKRCAEKIYGKYFLELLYGETFFSRMLSSFLLPLVAKFPFFSKLYGALQKNSLSKKKINPFIKKFQVDEKEFLHPSESFHSFNDFFIRKLKPDARPIVSGESIATLPADGRYLVYPNLEKVEGIWVKGKKFSLSDLLQSDALAKRYQEGGLVIARLCPVDYHRFHFPCKCTPSSPQLINGPLFSVNPIALKKNIAILAENKRVITPLATEKFGEVLFIEVGATHVGAVHQTFSSNTSYDKGEEKGYFSFGGSCILLLFEPGAIKFDDDLIEASSQGIEMRALFGQSLGRALK